MIHIYAAVAEKERALISQRTSAGVKGRKGSRGSAWQCAHQKSSGHRYGSRKGRDRSVRCNVRFGSLADITAVRVMSALPPIVDTGRHIQVSIWLSVYEYTP